MNIGCPREVKDKEFRVGIVPSGVKDIVSGGHRVFIEKGAGPEAGSVTKSTGLQVPLYWKQLKRYIQNQT